MNIHNRDTPVQPQLVPAHSIIQLDRWIDNLLCIFSSYPSHFLNSLLRAWGCEPSCFLWLPNYLRARSAELTAREGARHCFHDRDQWVGECALILQELLSQANKCKPPCWLGCRAEPSGGQSFCVPMPKLWNHQYAPWNQSIETRFVAEGRPTSREQKKRKIPKLWHIYQRKWDNCFVRFKFCSVYFQVSW